MKKQLLFIRIIVLLQTANCFLAVDTYAQKIAAGSNVSIAICNDNIASSWGTNSYGQLGIGSINVTYVPVKVSALNGIVAVTSEGDHTFFVKSDGTVWGCGYNGQGQLGNGTTANSNTPVQVSGLTGIIAAAAGSMHSLFLKNDSTVWACGWNEFGQLGNGTMKDTSLPVKVSGLTGIVAIAAGEAHSLFLKSDGTAWSCGNNNFGQLGKTSGNPSIPGHITAVTGVTSIAAGFVHSLFVLNNDSVYACGNNGYGTLGNGTTSSSQYIPVKVHGVSGITSVAGGDYHSLFLKNNGTVWSCGWNNTGQLGDGTNTDQWSPVQVSGLAGITAIAAGGGGNGHSLFLKNNDTLWACGTNGDGQLGNGTHNYSNVPVLVIGGLCPDATSVNEITQALSISVFPNPIENEITLSGTKAKGVAIIFDVTGREIIRQKTFNAETKINTAFLINGFYFLNYVEENKMANIKLIKV